MLSIQETLEKAKPQLKAIETFMDTHGYYEPYVCNRLLNQGLKRSIQRELHETINRLSIKEFMFKSGATGTDTSGQYLLAAVLASKIHSGIRARDRGAAIAADIIEEAHGETINALVSLTKAQKVGEAGARIPTGMIVSQTGITYEKFSCPLIGSYDIIEDSGYSLMDLASQNAGMSIAQLTNDQILSVLKRTSGTLGVGTKTTESAGAGTTTPAQIAACACEVAAGADGTVYHPNLLVISPEAWFDAVTTTAGHPDIAAPRNPQFDAWYGAGFNVVIVNSLELGTVSSNRLTKAVTIIMEKELGIAIARKQWLRIENYAQPKDDLLGAVVTARQACGELVDAAIGVLTES